MTLYPLKFTPKFFHKIWGGQCIKQWYRPKTDSYENVGESWLISAVEKYPTIVENGKLADNDLQDLLEVYMSELVGDKVYDVFGDTFPLLLKFIDADDDLSIQVHPNDDYALLHENSLGKNEMWYVMDSAPEASIIDGWIQPMTPELIRQAIDNGNLSDYLHVQPVQIGDAVMIPAGRVHALKKGTIVAEIQENSDLTYRLYDYNRIGNDGKMRPLKLDKALEVLDYSADREMVKKVQSQQCGVENLISSPYFVTNVMTFDRSIERDYAPLDSFVAYICVQGSVEVYAKEVETDNQVVSIKKGEAVLIPASLNDVLLRPLNGECKLLEVYMDVDRLMND